MEWLLELHLKEVQPTIARVFQHHKAQSTATKQSRKRQLSHCCGEISMRMISKTEIF